MPTPSASDFSFLAFLAIGGLALALALVLVLMLVARIRRRRFLPLVLHPQLDGVDTLDKAVARILDRVATWIPARAYYGYWLNPEGTLLQLRASVTQTGKVSVSPDYSGLVIDDMPLVPLSIKAEARGGPQLTGNKLEPWLEFSVGGHLVVRMLLERRQQVPRPMLRRLAEVRDAYAPLMLATYEWFRAREAVERVKGLVDSSRLALDTTLRPERAMELLLWVGGQLVEARVACGVVAGPTEPLVLAGTPRGQEVGGRILQGDVPELLHLPLHPDVVPGSIVGRLGPQFNACVRVPVYLGSEPMGCFYYFTEHAASLDAYQEAVLRTLGGRTAQLVASQQQFQQASTGYIDTLRALVDAMDGLTEHSVGHSERIARYARLMAEALGLPAAEVDAIALGAYFHDVGMVAVDTRIVLKPGRLTSDEYEQVKTHAELGGQLVGPIAGALPLAPIVTSHHERWDGHGYPEGLKSDQIPLGARIIAVADLFDAKTTGRSYRAPLPFAAALEDVRTAAGASLDPALVDAFLAGWDRQRRSAASDLPLGRCWEFKQLPEHVCSGCPNRVDPVLRCWENPNRLCVRHGDQCETCVVYTEAAARGLSVPGDASRR